MLETLLTSSDLLYQSKGLICIYDVVLEVEKMSNFIIVRNTVIRSHIVQHQGQTLNCLLFSISNIYKCVEGEEVSLPINIFDFD